jgi:hypothetical protein
VKTDLDRADWLGEFRVSADRKAIVGFSFNYCAETAISFPLLACTS